MESREHYETFLPQVEAAIKVLEKRNWSRDVLKALRRFYWRWKCIAREEQIAAAAAESKVWQS
jgi:hypothetical protein